MHLVAILVVLAVIVRAQALTRRRRLRPLAQGGALLAVCLVGFGGQKVSVGTWWGLALLAAGVALLEGVLRTERRTTGAAAEA